MRVLFVSNGHGEAAIAQRIGAELIALAPGARLDHLALVGDVASDGLCDVGPRREMPSGGLIAMGNVGKIARDLRQGLLALTLAQRSYLRSVRGAYDVTVAVGDAYALASTLLTKTPAVFVGTAKSVAVARYGWYERRLLKRAAVRFVRDEPTAQDLIARGVDARVGNAIADLFATPDDPSARNATDGFAPALALFPGSRESAYANASLLLAIVRRLGVEQPRLGAVLSVADGLQSDRFADDAMAAGWAVRRTSDRQMPFTLSDERGEVVRAWRGPIGAVLRRVELVLGQAGTANEAAAAAGIPIIAFEHEGDAASHWYRQRQRGLLGDALAVFPAEVDAAVNGVRGVLDDPERRRRMSDAGPMRLGRPGAALRIAQSIVAVAQPP